MKNTAFIKREAINWLFILLPFMYIFFVYDRLPPFAPFQMDKEQRIYQAVLFVMGVSLLSYLALLVKPSIVPKTAFHENLKSFHRMRTLILAFSSLLCMTFISEKIGVPFNWARIGFILAFSYMMAIGNLYPTIRKNFFVGIKNSWTQSNELIWRKTHRMAGKVFFVGGLIGVLYGILFDVHPVWYMPVILVGYVFGLKFIPTLYSYLLYRQLQYKH
ncbi:MAG: SdpI family protein [Mangrovibacterium sp.]|nr:SdpI family protein [Mangrovibacterium sp.]